ncbi:MAG TPA: hypothetical protein DEH02_19410 [Bacteroidales bacterium]|nr:MAG: hypothetical protein A2X01_11025 [Bacteroidetes bacterium GWF2_35_48]OFY99517.1 MAG: hypothetical protein A2491_05080 [Bacteroidetes bacterium RIFOXYC12_FULL_35_7]HBX53232.1 hypothetical protein [Bacteroidales bacterium]
MYTTFNIKVSDLDMNFLKALKTLFKNKESISITVESEMDETEYLLSSDANRKILEQSIAEAERGELIKVNLKKK